MSFVNKYPYTDFHELNLDWFLAEFKKVVDEWIQMKREFNDLESAVIDLRNFVNDYFENLDVQDEINNKLDAMAADGSLEAIVSNAVSARPRSTMYLSRIGRNVNTDNVQNGFIGCGAGVMIDDENYLYALYTDDALGTAMLIKTNINSGISVSNVVTGLYHANGACMMHNGNVAFVPMTDDAQKCIIIEVDPLALTVVETHNVTDEPVDATKPMAIGYDAAHEQYILMAGLEFYKVSKDYEFIERIPFDFPIVPSNITRQGGCVYNDYIGLVVNFPNQLLCFHLDGSYSHSIYLGQNQSGNNLGEIQNISVRNGVLWANANCTPHGHQYYSEIVFYSAPLNGGGFSQSLGKMNSYVENGRILYKVNLTNYNNLSDLNKFTTNGDTKPFCCIEEALLHMDDFHYYELELYNDNVTNLVIYDKNFVLKGNGHHIGNLVLKNCNCTISSILFDTSKDIDQDLGTGTHNCTLYAFNSNVVLAGESGILTSLGNDKMFIQASHITVSTSTVSEAGYTQITLDSFSGSDGARIVTKTPYGLSHVETITNTCCDGFVTSSSGAIVFTVVVPYELTSSAAITELKITMRDTTGTIINAQDVTSDSAIQRINRNMMTIAVTKSVSTTNNTCVSVYINTLKFTL